MQNQLRRTHATELTDAELILFDIIATRGGTRRYFHPDVFPLQYNYPSHGFTPNDLSAALNRFEASGWATGSDFIDRHSKSDREISITDAGARLWESERQPDWSRLVMEWYGRSRPNTERHRVSVLGHSHAICQRFFDVSCECGFFDYDLGPVVSRMANRKLIYWRPVQPVYLISGWLNSWHGRADWEHFQRERVWWRFADEIGTLWELPSADG
ncbi:hypothetical protein K239x_29610 [Planctomycetes bacterium K23_9]|uniref:Uncharacterized protein n=1 Tax=Stieleria marina TaxID=1930275 RepID=A0A517NV15_9BACT|nr:hypothetical protein K239x_29610 [Planctomycetes bacterium K23_9]